MAAAADSTLPLQRIDQGAHTASQRHTAAPVVATGLRSHHLLNMHFT